MALQLSKTEYIMMFLKHPAWLWLKKHDKSKLPVPDANLQAKFDMGNEFEKYAVKLFPDAVSLGFNNYYEYMDLPARTQQAIDAGTKTLLQGRLESGSVTCIFDVLDRVGDSEFDLYEIKMSAQVKPEHELDLAFQTIVLEDAGIKIRNILVIHVNSEYVRDGDIDIKKLSATEDVTEAARGRIEETREGIVRAVAVADLIERPDISPRHARMGGLGDWMEIYKGIVGGIDKYSIYNLMIPGEKRLGELEDLGIELIGDIPESVRLTKKQKLQVEATKTNKQYIDKEGIADFLDGLKYPLYFLDYETFTGVIPRFDGLHPHQQAPFQYSLHKIESPGVALTHTEYLHTEDSNPAKQLLEQLKKDIADEGSVLVWYEAFEKKCNESLAEVHPEYRDFLMDVNERIVDLMIPFAKDMFVDKDFFGSASIKNVLPVLVPELSYKELAIQEGGSAARIWMNTVFENKNAEKRKEIFNDLIEYCKMDTLAMVKILERLREEIKK